MSNRQLNQISTAWSVVCQAHQSTEDVRTAGRHLLLERYRGAVYRYLLGALRDADAADELSQEFALRFLRGDFHRAAPDRGRFRDFVKTALVRLVSRYRQQQRGQPRPLGYDVPEPVAAFRGPSNADEEFLHSWRSELLAGAWEALSQVQEKTGQPYYQVLRLRVEHPKMPAGQMAEHLSGQLGRSLTAAGVRQLLHRSREKFADFLLDRVRHALDNPTTEELEQELLDLDLLAYCKPALARSNGSPLQRSACHAP